MKPFYIKGIPILVNRRLSKRNSNPLISVSLFFPAAPVKDQVWETCDKPRCDVNQTALKQSKE